MGSRPDRVKMVGCSIYQSQFVGQNPCLEIALVITLHTDAGACQIGRTDVGCLTVENHHFEMNPWA